MPGTILLADLERANDDELRNHLNGLFSPPTASDSLTNPLGTGNAPAAPVVPPELAEHVATLLAPPPEPEPPPVTMPSAPPGGLETTGPPPVRMPSSPPGGLETTGTAPVPLPSGPPASVFDELANHVQQASGGALQLLGQGMTALGSGAEVVGQGAQNVISLARPPAPSPAAPAAATPDPDLAARLGGAAPGSSTAASGTYQDYAREAARRAGIDPELFVAQIQQESGFNPGAGSPAGALGIAQIVPKYHPGVDPSNPYASLDYAANLMKSHLRQYGGDYAKALVAYNGGGGAVAQLERGTPYQESQQYLTRILGTSRPNVNEMRLEGTTAPPRVPGAAAPTRDISQFGSQELTAAEAAAACGPAAAVRFAQRFGRNPTLGEATKIAATVGWTEGQGMAGLGSEKRLLDKMGVANRMIGGRAWDEFARVAQTGNPVIISTPGHYFYADTYDPTTKKFHVGASGTDLRRGAAWMSQAEMESVMGTAQGGLVSDNPTVPAGLDGTVSRTRETAPDRGGQQIAQVEAPQPLKIIGDVGEGARAKAGDVVAGGLRIIDSAVEAARDTASQAGQQLATGGPPPAAAMPTPSDTLTNPTVRQAPPSGVADAKSALADFTAPRFPAVGEAIGGALGSLGGPGIVSDEEILRRAKPNEIANARATVQGFNDAYTDKRGLPRETVSDSDVAAYLRGIQTAQVAALSSAPGVPRTASGADRLQGFMSSSMLLNPGSQVMNAVTQTEQTLRSPAIRALAGYPDEALEGLRMLGAASADGLKGVGQMLVRGTSRSNPAARPIGLEAPGLRLTGAQDELFREVGGKMEWGMELRRLIKENPGVPEPQLVQQFDKELQEAAAKGGASAVFGEGGAAGGLGSKIAQLKSELINNDDPNVGKRIAKQGLGWLLYGAVPFSQMPETLLKTGLRRVPVASEAIGLGETAAAVARGDRRGARLKFAETTLDGAINSAIVYHVLQGNITGPDDPEHPAKVRIGDKWFDYSSLGPLGLRMGATAAMVDALKREDNKLNPDKLGAVINSFGKVATNEWFLEGAADAVSQFGQGGAERVLGRQVQALGDRLVPVGSLLDYINKSTDPLERNPSRELPNAIWERPESRIPGLSQFVPPKIDPTTGQPQRRVEQGPGAQLLGVETEQSDAAQAELARLKRGDYSVSEPEAGPKSFTIAGAEIQMTPDERRVYEEARGKAIAQFAETMQTPEYQKGDDNYKARFWAAALGKASDVARAKVLEGMSEEERTKRIQEGFRTVGKLTPLTPEPTTPTGPPVVR